MKIKSANVRIKAAGAADGLADGEFSAIVSVFNNVDSYGDVMMPGSFNDTLKSWADKGDPIPVIWSHDWTDPASHIGTVLEAREVPAGEFGDKSPAGLWVKGLNDIANNPRAAQVQRLMQGRRVTQFSFAYDEKNAGWGVHDGQEAWLVHAVDLHEVGPTLLGVNQSTDLIGAKRAVIDLASRSAKSGARHSAADMALLDDMHAALTSLGVSCGSNDDGKASQDATGKHGADHGDVKGTGGPTAYPAQDDLSTLLSIDTLLSDLD